MPEHALLATIGRLREPDYAATRPCGASRIIIRRV
jgi:hypothetical protein